MRVSLTLSGLALLLLAGCGGARTNDDLSTSGEGANPGVNPGAAPNVAFSYRYSFGLSADQIGPIQQRHARLCEEMGAERCQVTDFDFRRDGDNDVRAELTLAVARDVAHRFGEQALDSVREADGTLVDTEVTGNDVEPQVRAGNRAIAEEERQLAEIQQRIERSRDPALTRTLEEQAANLRARIRSARGDGGDVAQRLAMTPVALTYSSSPLATGTPDFGGVLGNAWSQVKWIAYGLFWMLMLVSPWAMVGGLIWFAARRLRRGRRTGDDAVEA